MNNKRRYEEDKQDRCVPEKASRSSNLDEAVLEAIHSMRTLTIMTERFPEEVFKQVSFVFDASDRVTPTLLALSRYEEALSGVTDQQEKLGMEVKEILEKTEELISSSHTIASIRSSTNAIMAEINEALRLLQ
ncbi:hypothetical protein FO519_010342 [Halicephalobus sp. NKZ332]|nr:hypothetical protein FO519_010342 [Halicephalobus sp. NKZ332]